MIGDKSFTRSRAAQDQKEVLRRRISAVFSRVGVHLPAQTQLLSPIVHLRAVVTKIVAVLLSAVDIVCSGALRPPAR